MTKDEQKLGLRITSGTKDERKALFFNRTKKSGPAQNARHILVQPLRPTIISDLDPAVIGKTVLQMLELE